MQMSKNKYGYLEGIISIFANIILFFLKYWAGIVSGSVALIADAWHTLSDSISSIIVIAGIKLSSKKPDKKHPFGHGRWEQITAIFIGFMLGIIAYEFMRESIEKLQVRESAHFGTLAIIATVTSIIMKEALAQFAFWTYRKTDNTSLRADAWHHRSDALSSVIVLIGLFLKDYFWWIDSVLGIIISLMLFYAVFDIVRDAISKLLGEEASPELIDRIKKVIADLYPLDLSPHHFHIHNYGTHKEITFHIKMDGTKDINAAHEIAQEIENKMMETLNIEATIHIDPIVVNK